jgi:hypothetical protein
VIRTGWLLALLLVLGVPATVEAHALGAEAKLKNGKVTVEAFYDDDTPAGGATIVVTGADGQSVAEGKTDERGRWTFDAPPAGRYKVAVRSRDEHKATVALVIPDTGKPAWFKLTDQSLDALRREKVPETVLAHLSTLKNKVLRRDEFERALAFLLSPEEKEQFFNPILNRAREPAPPARPGEPTDSTAPLAPDEGVTVSEGPTRSEFTGPRRLVWAIVGLVIIGGATWAVLRLVRAVKRSPAPRAKL